MKRAIYIINAILGSLTILGFITIYIGLVGLFVMGCLHILILIYYITQWKTLSQRNRQDIRNYGYLLGSIAIISLISYALDLDLMMFVIMALAIGAGIYFTVIIHRIYKGEKEIQKPETIEGILDSGLD
jgi:hypothetical protein